MLKAKKPKDIPKRLKLLLYGPAGVGKTMATIQMPCPYVIDCEKGTDYYGDMIEEKGGVVFQTTQMVEVIGEVKSLICEEHEHRTLVIDPITTAYQDLLDQCEKEVGNQWGRHYGAANRHMKRLANLLMALDMNVIVTAHAKAEYGENMVKTGQTFDGWKRLDYLFDLVLELERQGKKRMARVVKSRMASFPDGERFEWSYDAIADRYGRDILERRTAPTALATPEHLQRLRELLNQLSDAEKRRLGIDKALAGVDDISDMPDERVAAGIELIERHLAQAATA